MNESDGSIARAFGAGHAEALSLVYERYGVVLFGYLRGVISDVGRAEDVFQQVMTEVWSRRAQYDPTRASLLTWMMTRVLRLEADHQARLRDLLEADAEAGGGLHRRADPRLAQGERSHP